MVLGVVVGIGDGVGLGECDGVVVGEGGGNGSVQISEAINLRKGFFLAENSAS